MENDQIVACILGIGEFVLQMEIFNSENAFSNARMPKLLRVINKCGALFLVKQSVSCAKHTRCNTHALQHIHTATDTHCNTYTPQHTHIAIHAHCNAHTLRHTHCATHTQCNARTLQYTHTATHTHMIMASFHRTKHDGDAVCVLPSVAVRCSVLQYAAVHSCALQCVAVCCSVLQCVAVCCSAIQCVAVRCSVPPWALSIESRVLLTRTKTTEHTIGPENKSL